MPKSIGIAGFLLTILVLAACGKKDSTLNEMVTNGVTVASGTFSGTARYNTSGMVRVVDSGMVRTLVFDQFRTDPGPNLDVYLATDLAASTFISLGDLKATNGRFEYRLDKSIDLGRYKYVLVWCVSFSALFGSAPLQ